MSEWADFLYRVTDFWSPTYERAMLWNDPQLRITWPLPAGTEPLLSPKDAIAARFAEAECFP